MCQSVFTFTYIHSQIFSFLFLACNFKILILWMAPHRWGELTNDQSLLDQPTFAKLEKEELLSQTNW